MKGAGRTPPHEQEGCSSVGCTVKPVFVKKLFICRSNRWLIGKDPDAGKDCRWEEKGTKENELDGWHHQLNGHEFGYFSVFCLGNPRDGGDWPQYVGSQRAGHRLATKLPQQKRKQQNCGPWCQQQSSSHRWWPHLLGPYNESTSYKNSPRKQFTYS